MGALHDSGLSTIRPGMILAYVLTDEDMPADPNKKWRGKVIQCYQDSVHIEMLEPGYHTLTETILYEQIIAVEN